MQVLQERLPGLGGSLSAQGDHGLEHIQAGLLLVEILQQLARSRFLAAGLRGLGQGGRCQWGSGVRLFEQGTQCLQAIRGLLAGEQQLWQLYDQIPAQVLLLRGAESDLLSSATAREMTARGPRARLVEFAGVGHAPTLVQPDQVAVVAQFLLERQEELTA